MTPIHTHEINHKGNFDDYLQLALLLPVLFLAPALLTWRALELGAAGALDLEFAALTAAWWAVPAGLVWLAGSE